MKLRIRTRDLELPQALDEVFLRIFLLGLRICQTVFSLPMIGFAAAFISDLSSEEQGVPSKVTAALATEGLIFFTITAIIDVLFVAAWSSLIGVWDSDGTGTCSAFIAKYFDGRPQKSYFITDCRLVKAMFAFMIIHL